MSVEIDTGLGCDNCGHSKDSHVGEELACPVRRQYSRATWKQTRWYGHGHSVSASIDYNVSPRIICPPDGSCLKVICRCREESYEDARPDCPHCHGEGVEPDAQCWLQHVAGEIGPDFWETSSWCAPIVLDHGPVPIVYQGSWDDFAWRPISPAIRQEEN